MIICFQYNCMELIGSRQQKYTLPDVGLDGVGFDVAFTRLIEGMDSFSVACGDGFLRRLHDYLTQRYIFIKAAGGIVRNEENKLLLMRRNDRWDLPKGKVEVGETLAQAAVRETQEETGLINISLGPLWLKTYHIYNLYGGWHFKQTSWFEMRHFGKETLVPQLEEGITEVGWYDEDTWRSNLDMSYATMRLIMRQ
ncbi:MAG: NUDIX domain-containing protein [Bacteroidales bacterium]|nr:NUDIX domain-containing protein [Bacteroidales bacterium]